MMVSLNMSCNRMRSVSFTMRVLFLDLPDDGSCLPYVASHVRNDQVAADIVRQCTNYSEYQIQKSFRTLQLKDMFARW